jgi:hypothetical protein
MGKGCSVKSSTLFVLLLLICLSLLLLSRTPVHAQKEVTPDRLPFPQTDDRFDTILRMRTNAENTTRIDPDRLQREGKELLELSQSLQPELQYVKQGLLPKDTVEKLKRIEKLSKHLRGELAH